MYSINQFSLQRLSNAEFVAMMINLSNLIEYCEASKLGFDTGMMTSFVSLKNKLSDQVKVSSSSAITLEMESANQKRINLFKRLIYRLKGVELNEGNALYERLAPLVNLHLLKPYGLSVTRMPIQEITTLIAGFVYDAQSKFTEDDLDDLDITTDVTNLESANQEFIAAYTRRSNERAETSGQTQVLRQQMYELYLSMCYQVQYLANSTLEANATKAAACQPFIGALNSMLADAKKRYTQRMNALHQSTEGGTEGNGSETPAGGNDPAPAEGGDSNPAGGNSNPDAGNTPAGGNSNPDGGDDTPAGGDSNPGEGEIDRENGTLHDGTVEY